MVTFRWMFNDGIRLNLDTKSSNLYCRQKLLGADQISRNYLLPSFSIIETIVVSEVSSSLDKSDKQEKMSVCYFQRNYLSHKMLPTYLWICNISSFGSDVTHKCAAAASWILPVKLTIVHFLVVSLCDTVAGAYWII